MNNKKLVIGFIVVSVLILIGAAYLLGKNENNSSIVASSSTQNTGSPKVEAKEISSDLGKMKVSDERYHDFIIKNDGTAPLDFSNIKSSCMCTAGKIIYKSRESDEFGMHSGGNFSGIAPGDEATIRVIYRPYEMPVYGPIEREVYVTTNDPLNQQLTFKITANVQ